MGALILVAVLLTCGWVGGELVRIALDRDARPFASRRRNPKNRRHARAASLTIEDRLRR